MSRLSPLTPFEISQLPKPDIVETLAFELIVAESRADFLERWAVRRAADPELPVIDAATLELETDPIVIQLQAGAFRETLWRARVNDAARALLVAFSRGADLDHLAAGLDVRREVVRPAEGEQPAELESDASLARRVLLAPSAFNTAGAAKAYVFYALSAAPSLADASAVKAQPGQVVVTLLGRAQDAPTEAEIAAVRAVLHRDDVLPTTAYVTVQAPAVKAAAIVAELTLFPGPVKAPIVAEAEARLNAFLAVNRRLGSDLTRSAILARLHVDGVHSVTLISPSADITAEPGEVARVTSLSITAPERAA